MATRSSDAAAKAKDDTNTDDLVKQVEALRSDFAALTEILGDLGAQGKDEATDRVRQFARDTRSAAEREAEALRTRAEEAGDAAMAAVRRQPATAIGLAVGLGFLVGVLTSRR